MTDNFVDVIGFGLEKVHTGVIAWLLDSDKALIPSSDRLLLLERLLDPPLEQSHITGIKPIREYSFGRKMRIDLVVEINSASDDHYLVFECKTDSDVYLSQLEKTRTAFLEKHPPTACKFILLVLGASQFTSHPLPQDPQRTAQKIEDLGYQVLDVPTLRSKFSGLSITGHSKVYDDWLKSLDSEQERFENIEQALAIMEHPWDERLQKMGYRRGFHVFYLYYAKLRQYLKGGSDHWAICSGGNNPVLNWQQGWLQKGTGDERLDLYWEFNWESFCLKAELGTEKYEENGKEKVKITETSRQKWNNLKGKIQAVCESSKHEGRKTKDTQGFWITAYKWDFKFCKERICGVAEKTNAILDELHPKLCEIY